MTLRDKARQDSNKTSQCNTIENLDETRQSKTPQDKQNTTITIRQHGNKSRTCNTIPNNNKPRQIKTIIIPITRQYNNNTKARHEQDNNKARQDNTIQYKTKQYKPRQYPIKTRQ